MAANIPECLRGQERPDYLPGWPPERRRQRHAKPPEVARAMTIAAAFTLDDGVLFVADTQYSWTGLLKLESSKLFQKTYGEAKPPAMSAFAIAGDEGLCRMMVQHCEAKLGKIPKGKFSREQARKVIEQSFADDFRQYVHPDPDRHSFGIEMLIGVYCPVDRNILVLRNQPVSPFFVEMFGYSAIGAGMPLCHYLVRDKYPTVRGDRGLAFDMAVESIKAVKEYVDGCGDSTDVLWLGRAGAWFIHERLDDSNKREVAAARSRLIGR